MTNEQFDELKKMAEQWRIDKYPTHSGTCPNCGYCPHCGRGGHQTLPYYPTYPIYPQPYYPPWHQPYITWTSDNITLTGNTQ